MLPSFPDPFSASTSRLISWAASSILRTASAVAATPTRLLYLERSALLALLEELPGLAMPLLRNLSARVRELTDRLEAGGDASVR